MATDQAALFADDTAADVRATYRAALEEGLADGEAEDATLREFAAELLDGEQRVVVWLALAATQSQLGRLSVRVRREALHIIDRGADLAQWRDAGPQAVSARTKVLQRLAATLQGPQPSRKRIRRAVRRPATVNPGQVLAYRTTSGRTHLIHVIGIVEDGPTSDPIVEILDYAAFEPPTDTDIAAAQPRVPRGYERPYDRFNITERRGDNITRHGIHAVGTKQPLTDIDFASAWKDWESLAAYLDQRDQSILSQDDDY